MFWEATRDPPFTLAEDVLVAIGQMPTPVDKIQYSFDGVFLCTDGRIYAFEMTQHRLLEGGIVEIFTIDPVTLGLIMKGEIDTPTEEVIVAVFKPSQTAIWGSGKARRRSPDRPDPVLVATTPVRS